MEALIESSGLFLLLLSQGRRDHLISLAIVDRLNDVLGQTLARLLRRRLDDVLLTLLDAEANMLQMFVYVFLIIRALGGSILFGFVSHT